MEINGPQNNLPNIPDVLDDVNGAADQANELASEQAQTALGSVFFSLIQRIMSSAQENSGSGA